MIRRVAAAGTVFLLVLLCAARVADGQTIAELAAPLAARVEALVSEEMARVGAPAISVAVAVEGELRYANGFGQADVENCVPARADSLYRTASIAKPMTSAVVLRLAEQGKIDLDAAVQTYCAEFPTKEWPVTSRQLLGHLGGVRHYNGPAEQYQTQRYFALAPTLAIFAGDPLICEPGTKFHYTSFGYNLLGSVAEGAAKREFVEMLGEFVFAPAGMNDTRTDDQAAIVPRRVRGYVRPSEKDLEKLPAGHRLKAGELYNAPLHDTSSKIPGGGLLSTAPDLVRFALAISAGKLLKAETVAAAWTRQKTADGKETDYGLGWRIGEVDGKRAVSHGGGQAGTSTYLLLLPDEGVAVAAMCNLQGVKLEAMAEAIARRCMGEE